MRSATRERRFVCIRCPYGCDIHVTYETNKVLGVDGHRCDTGVEYVTGEIEDPRRVLTTTMRVRNGTSPLVSVRTRDPIPRALLREAMRFLAGVEPTAPVKRGDVLVADLFGTGTDVIATSEVWRRDKEKK
jgi:CxxC motif-containing protein